MSSALQNLQYLETTNRRFCIVQTTLASIYAARRPPSSSSLLGPYLAIPFATIPGLGLL